jgi:hypothetical protein
MRHDGRWSSQTLRSAQGDSEEARGLDDDKEAAPLLHSRHESNGRDAAMPRTFTLDEANALLPRLREILAEMREKKPAVDRLRDELAKLTRTTPGNGHVLEDEVARRRREAQPLVERLNELLQEIDRIGCELKGVEEGLVDVRAEREGRTIYLCWRLGEERIAYWHELDTGFGGRQPL